MACALHFKKKKQQKRYSLQQQQQQKKRKCGKKMKKKIWNTCKKIFFEISNTHKYIHHHFGL